MLRSFTLLIAAGVACFGQTSTAINFYSLEKEQAFGAGMVATARRQVTVVENSTIQAYVERIGQRLAASIPNSPFPYQFTIVQDTPGVTFIEPVSFPGGYVFVPLSLIQTAKDEDEFAGLLAHSMIHISQRHATRMDTSSEIVNLATIPLVFMSGGWTNYGIRQAATLAIPVGFLAFQRRYEREADQMAVTTTAAAGFDPAALGRYIGRLQRPAQGTVSTAFSAYPPAAERVANINNAVEQLRQQLPDFERPASDTIP